VIGVALFGLHRAVAPAAVGHEIIVPSSLVAGLARDQERRSGHAPTAEERAGLVRRWVDDEIRYREALDLGLDQGDIIVRRRLVQKMDFLLEGSTPIPAPTDAELETFLAANAARYARPDRVGIEQVFASYGTPGEPAEARATGWLAALAKGTSPATLGDPFMRGRTLASQSEADLTGTFGPEFAAAVLALPVGVWRGPIVSSYGAHDVRVTTRTPGSVPPLAEVRDAVLRDWRAERREALDRQALDDLRKRWTVRVEPAP
jgi:hypothetical protein